jgi:hypothetical protein
MVTLLINRFSHLINVEVVLDLMEALTIFMSNVNLNIKLKLECMAAAFGALKHQGNAHPITSNSYLQML